jgi:mannose/fructose/N-acetylgalactosamine-specific phosphotransferase system component IID
MKNTTILIILLLIVSSTLYFKNKEGLDTAGLTGDSLQKTVIINDINGKIIDMNVDYKVFNDETTNMARQQKLIFYIMSGITSVAVLFTIYYILKD